MDKLTSMGVFAKAVEAASFTGAAQTLRISPQAVGKHVRALEEHLGVKLIHRTTRKQSLTEFGREYYERVKLILTEIDVAESLAEESQAVPRGKLRINAPVTFGAHELACVLPEYLASNPEVDIELILADRLVDLVEEGYDAVFRTGPLQDSGLIARKLKPMRFALCAAPSYVDRCGQPATPGDLRSHQCLGFAYGATRDHWVFAGPGGETKVEVTYRLIANNGQALLTSGLAGLGILMQPEALLQNALDEKRLFPLLPDYKILTRPLHVLYAPDRRVTPKLRSFLDFAIEKFG